MSWWNMGGMNPKFKDFIERYPDKTMIGMIWALYWRFMVCIMAIELGLMIIFLLFGSIFNIFH